MMRCAISCLIGGLATAQSTSSAAGMGGWTLPGSREVVILRALEARQRKFESCLPDWWPIA